MNRYAPLAIVFAAFVLVACDSQAFPDGTYEWHLSGKLVLHVVISSEEIVFDGLSASEEELISKRLQDLGMQGGVNACVVTGNHTATLTQWKGDGGRIYIPEMKREIIKTGDTYIIRDLDKLAADYPDPQIDRVGDVDKTLCQRLWREEVACKAGVASKDDALLAALWMAEDLHPETELVAKIQKMMAVARKENPEICDFKIGPPAPPDEILVDFKEGYDPSDLQVLEGFPEIKEATHRVSPGEYDNYILSFSKPINTILIVDRFHASLGVKSMQPIGGAWVPNYVKVDHEEGVWLLSYRVGWGFCPLGKCEYTHTWNFQFNEGGEVVGKEETGNQLPSLFGRKVPKTID